MLKLIKDVYMLSLIDRLQSRFGVINLSRSRDRLIIIAAFGKRKTTKKITEKGDVRVFRSCKHKVFPNLEKQRADDSHGPIPMRRSRILPKLL